MSTKLQSHVITLGESIESCVVDAYAEMISGGIISDQVEKSKTPRGHIFAERTSDGWKCVANNGNEAQDFDHFEECRLKY